MRYVRAVLARIAGMFRKDRADDDLRAELRAHLEMHAAENIRRGMQPDEARRQAMLASGGLTQAAEAVRDRRGLPFVESIVADIRYAFRSLSHSPAFTTVVVVTLALALGVNAALFTVVRDALRPPPMPHPETFVRVPLRLSYEDVRLLREHSRTLTRVNPFSTEWVVVSSDGERAPERLVAKLVTEDYFADLGGRAQWGRVFGEHEAAPATAARVVVLSERFWRTRYGSDTTLIGQTIRLGQNEPFTVVGIMPREFIGVDRNTPDMWLPLGARPWLVPYYMGTRGRDWFGASGPRWLEAYARIATGSSARAAGAELTNLIVLRVDTANREMRPLLGSLMTAAERRRLPSNGGVSGAMTVVGATLCVLLIGCVTVTNLVLARGTARRREIAVRLSLGATRWRVIRQLTVEGAVLAGIAAAAGGMLGWASLRLVASSPLFAPVLRGADPLLFVERVRPDIWTCVFAIGATLACTILVGFVPALRVTRTGLHEVIKRGATTGASRWSPMGSSLIVAQIAVTTVLLMSGSLLTRAVWRSATLDLGFDREHLAGITTWTRLSGYDSARTAAFERAIEARLVSVPGVRAVARGNMPLVQRVYADVSLPGQRAEESVTEANVNPVTPGFFATTGIRLLHGRTFTAEETWQQSPVVVVSASTAAALWPGESPLGKTISVAVEGGTASYFPAGRFTAARVIGVASDAQSVALGETDKIMVYIPASYGGLVIQTSEPAHVVTPRIRALLNATDPSLYATVTAAGDLIATANNGVEGARTAMAYAVSIAVLSLVLCVVGLFGVTAYAVVQRLPEFGIRLALGAQNADVIGLVMKRGLLLVASGCVVGLVGSAFATRVLRGALFGLPQFDLPAHAAAMVVMGTVTVLSCYVPARRATRVDPVETLRRETT